MMPSYTVHGVQLEWTHAPSYPGPEVGGGMGTCDIKTWYRVDKGPWWLPNHHYSLIGDKEFWKTLEHCKNKEEVLALFDSVTGRKQFEEEEN